MKKVDKTRLSFELSNLSFLSLDFELKQPKILNSINSHRVSAT